MKKKAQLHINDESELFSEDFKDSDDVKFIDLSEINLEACQNNCRGKGILRTPAYSALRLNNDNS